MKHADSLIARIAWCKLVSVWVCCIHSFTVLCTNSHIHYVQTLSFVFQECGLIWCELLHFVEELRLVCLINLFSVPSNGLIFLGVFEFYYAQLAPVIQYRDLRTEVFQSFKEIGNTILFCLLLEKALVWSDMLCAALVYIIFLSVIIEASLILNFY